MERLIHNVSAFDGNNPTLRKGVNIAIEDDLITEITTGAMEAEKFNQVINGKRMTAIPGWIDCHTYRSSATPDGWRDRVRLDKVAVWSVRFAHEMPLRGFPQLGMPEA